MVSIPGAVGPNSMPNPEQARVDRDREIALAFVALEESRDAAQKIHQDTGIPLRTIYRAVKRQLDWARSAPASGKVTGPKAQQESTPDTAA